MNLSLIIVTFLFQRQRLWLYTADDAPLWLPSFALANRGELSTKLTEGYFNFLFCHIEKLFYLYYRENPHFFLICA